MVRSSIVRLLSIALATLALAACGNDARETGCNGYDELCDRPVDQVVFAMTHNSHATDERFYNPAARNHMSAVPTQLADGVRALNFDVYYEEDQIWVCHGYCALGHQDFVEILGEVREFLDDHPREVVLLTFESYISAADTAASFDAADLTRLVHTQTPGAAWPTLAEMIDANRRLVVFTNNEPGTPAWYHDENDFLYGTAWGTAKKEELNCDLTSGPLEHGLFVLNHTLTDPIAGIELAEQINYNPFLIDRVHDCEQQVGRQVNAIEVDYYETGDLIETVAILNGVAH